MKAAIATIVLAAVALGGCGAAQQAGKGAAEGAITTLAQKAGGRGGVEQVAEALKRKAIGGAMDELAAPERLEEFRRIAGAGI